MNAPPLGKAILRHMTKQFFTEYLAFIRQLFSFAKQYDAIKQDDENAMQEMTSEAFWRDIYK